MLSRCGHRMWDWKQWKKKKFGKTLDFDLNKKGMKQDERNNKKGIKQG